MIDAAQAQQALAQPLGIANPLGTRRNGCIGAGDAGFFCKYVTDYLAEAGFADDQILRGGYTIKTTLDRERDGEDEGLAERSRCPRTRRTSRT